MCYEVEDVVTEKRGEKTQKICNIMGQKHGA